MLLKSPHFFHFLKTEVTFFSSLGVKLDGLELGVGESFRFRMVLASLGLKILLLYINNPALASLLHWCSVLFCNLLNLYEHAVVVAYPKAAFYPQ